MPRLLLLAALACTLGCAPQVQHVRVHFGYASGERILDTSEEELGLAVGSEAEVRVFTPHGARGAIESLTADEVDDVPLVRAASSDPGVVRVLAFEGSRVQLAAGHPGSATLTVVTADGVDDIAVHVGEPALVRVWHEALRLAGGPPAVFLVGGVGRFHIERRDMADRLLGGHGAELPVRVDPPGAAELTLHEGDTSALDVSFAREGQVVLRPLGGEPVTLDVVSPDSVSGFGVGGVGASGETEFLGDVPVGETRLAVVWARNEVGLRVLGLGGHAELVTRSPEVCDVEDQTRWLWDGVFAVHGAVAGDCLLEAQLDGRTVAVSVPVSGPEPTDGPGAQAALDGDGQSAPEDSPSEPGQPAPHAGP